MKPAQRSIGSIAVFCGSNVGLSDAYADGARELGRVLGASDISLIYGGTTKGLMGMMADAALEAGGEVHGVITERLHSKGHTHQGLASLTVERTLHERKERMREAADAFIALPGGIGSLEEFMEVWSMNQLCEIDKPIGLLNLENYFEHFLMFIDHMVDTRFLPEAHRHSIACDPSPTELIASLKSHTRVVVPKWL